MSERKMVSERDAVLRERAAFDRGYRTRPYELWADMEPGRMSVTREERQKLDAVAGRIYPLPKVERPRVVRDPHGMNVNWTVVDGEIRPRVRSEWGQRCCEKITPERVALWADLLANPTETVEDTP